MIRIRLKDQDKENKKDGGWCWWVRGMWWIPFFCIYNKSTRYSGASGGHLHVECKSARRHRPDSNEQELRTMKSFIFFGFFLFLYFFWISMAV